MQALGRRLGWRDAARAAVWVALTAAVLGTLVSVVGVEDVLAELAAADRRLAAVVAAVVVASLLPRGVGLWLVLSAVGERRPLGHSVALLYGITFVNRITPSGQAGGTAVNGLLAARVVDVRYETAVAAILSLDTLNNVVILSLGLAGAGALALAGTAGGLGAAVLTAAALLAGILAGAVALWQFGPQLRELATRALVPLSAGVGRLLPRVDPPDAAAVAARVDGFGGALAAVGDAPRTVAAVLALSTVGRLLRALGLWLAFQSVGLAVSPLVLLAVVPAAAVAAAAPVPGGGGTIEAVLVALIVAATGLAAPAVTAAVLLYRGLTYWLETLTGGVTAGALLAATG